MVGYPEPYLSYFAPPGNGRYYRVDRGPLSICCIDSMPGEPDGWTADSLQAAWLREELAAAPGPWKVVAMHHPPYSSGFHGSADWMRWPFAAWGAQLVLAGHDHTYERILRDEITYVVNGLGGAARYAAGFQPVEGSAIFFNAEHGALLISADDTRLQLQFVTASGRIIDDVVIA
ncbi:MAG: alkaline phosphatase [Oscillochloris sp.]|nr:alkaline phosphatase [Oscillochloris sp.]